MSIDPVGTPSLLGDWEDEQAAAQRAREDAAEYPWVVPATCPRCGTTETSGYLLRLGHNVRPPGITTGAGLPYDSATDRPCTAQWLTENHITYYARRGDVAALERDAARGRALGLDVDAIITAARQKVAPA